MKRECVIWCAVCNQDRFIVYREPTGQEGHFRHKLESVHDQPLNQTKECHVCGNMMMRKIGDDARN